jgi:hypothetical protein
VTCDRCLDEDWATSGDASVGGLNCEVSTGGWIAIRRPKIDACHDCILVNAFFNN